MLLSIFIFILEISIRGLVKILKGLNVNYHFSAVDTQINFCFNKSDNGILNNKLMIVFNKLIYFMDGKKVKLNSPKGNQ